MNSTGYAGGAMQFTTAAAQSVAISRCLQEARVNDSRPAASAATMARAALLSGNATGAAAEIQSALCSSVTATATAEAFAEVISSSVGCNSTVQSALQCELCLLLYILHTFHVAIPVVAPIIANTAQAVQGLYKYMT